MLSFNNDGLLPPGDYSMTFSELRSSILVQGLPDHNETWDSEWRAWLVDNLEILVGQLWIVGIEDIYINGSFVEDKGHPHDIDGYFECDLFSFKRIQAELSLLDDCWTWDRALRRAYRGQPKKQLPMWHKYRIELYPHFGQLSGIKDEFGNDQQFPAAFRKTRRLLPNTQKGIVKIAKDGGEKL